MASRRTTTRPAPDRMARGTTRVALYLRISTDEDHQPFSLSAQEHRLAAFVASQPGWEHVKTYTDQFSGAYSERPGLSDALRDARLGLYDTLLVYRVDRFARSLKVLVGLLEELEAMGVAFRSATEPIDTSTATGRMLIQLLGVFAEFERATIIDRVVAGMERKAARGGWPGGSVPYGLQLDEDHHLAVRESEFPIVKRIFARYAIDKARAVTIATELNDDGLRTRTGKRWSGKVVLGILRNRGYLGEISFRDIVYQADEPLLDPILFGKAQALLDERGERYDRRFADTPPPHPLPYYCNYSCASHPPIFPEVLLRLLDNPALRQERLYRCAHPRRRPRRRRPHRTRRPLQRPRAHHPRLRSKPQTSMATARQQREELAATEAEIAKTEAAVDRYMHAFEAGTLTAEIFADRVRDLGDKARALRLRYAELGRAAVHATAPLPTEAEVNSLRGQLQEVALRGPGRVRKAVAQAFVHSLTVESRDRILPKFEIRRGLTVEVAGEHDGTPSQGAQGQAFRATTPTVVLRCHYANTPPVEKALVTAVVDGVAIRLAPSNAVLRAGDGDR